MSEQNAAEKTNNVGADEKGGNGGFFSSKPFLVIRIAIAVGLVALILKVIDLHSVGQTLAGTDVRFVAVIFGLAIFDRWLMARKWANLVRSQHLPFGDWEALKLYLSAMFVGTALPTSIGSDVYRAVRTGGRGRRMKVITSSIVLERVLGMLAIALLTLVGVGILAVTQPRIHALFAPVAIGVGLLFVGAIISIHPTSSRLLQRLIGRFQYFKPVRILFSLHATYMEYGRQRGVLVSFYSLSVLEQMVTSMMTYFGALALGFSTPILYFLALVPLSQFVTLLPISIGEIGVTEGAYVFIFALAGMSSVDALSLALLMRIVKWVMLTPGAVVFVYEAVHIKHREAVKRDENRVDA